jgi:hypothetical protein
MDGEQELGHGQATVGGVREAWTGAGLPKANGFPPTLLTCDYVLKSRFRAWREVV